MEIVELVKKCQERDQQAFGELYDVFADRIFKYICLKVKDRQQAEDILQEVFAKAWQGIPSLKIEGLNFNAWLYRVAGNTINDYFRKLYRTVQTAELTEGVHIASGDSPSEELVIKDDIRFMKQALEKLPSHYRAVLELRFIQDFTIAETAHIMRKNNLSIRLLQHRALKKLRDTIKQEHVYEYEQI